MPNHKEKYSIDSPLLKDNRLSEYRTDLANERTFLSYVRTSLSFFILAVFLVKFLSNGTTELAIAATVFGVVALAVGIVRFHHYREKIARAQKILR